MLLLIFTKRLVFAAALAMGSNLFDPWASGGKGQDLGAH